MGCAAVFPSPAVQYYTFKPDKSQGILGRLFKASRSNTLDKLLELAASKGLVVVTGPSMTGKTSLWQQLARAAEAQGWGRIFTLSALDGGNDLTVDQLIRRSTRKSSAIRSWADIWGQSLPNALDGGLEPPGNVCYVIVLCFSSFADSTTVLTAL